MKPFRFLCAFSLLCSAGHLTLPQSAGAMGHGPAFSIEHLNRNVRTVWLHLTNSAVASNETLKMLGQFEMGGGHQIQVLSERPKQSNATLIELPWPSGSALAFIEGEAPVAGQLVAGRYNQGLYVLPPEEILRLQKNAMNFVWPLSVSDQHVVKASSHERPNLPSPAPWQPRAVTKAEAVYPDLNRVMQTLEVLTGDRSFLLNGKEVTITERGSTDNRSLTQQYVMQTLGDLGIETKLVPYTYNGYTGANVEGTLWGTDRTQFIIISAHMDSVRNKGADDDGSGTASLLETAHLLTKLGTLPVSVRFVGFDQEELGLIGSRAYAKQLSQDETVLGVVQADMIAYDGNNDDAYHTMDCNRPDSKPITRVVEEINANLELNLKKVTACTNRSDHASFWSKNIAATIISENFFGNDSNPCYHQKCDLINLVNKEYMLKLVTLHANTTLSLALSPK